jgi:hypothetical protein
LKGLGDGTGVENSTENQQLRNNWSQFLPNNQLHTLKFRNTFSSLNDLQRGVKRLFLDVWDINQTQAEK